MNEHINTITDLLLGAAYADKRLEGDELLAISKMLCKLVGEDTLPAALSERVGAFNPAKFDVAAASSSLTDLTHEEKHTVLDLIATVNDADDVLDLDEDAYLRRVATGVGLGEDEIKEMTIEILSEDDLGGLLAENEDAE